MRIIPQPTPAQIARFWSYVDRSGGPDACWPWIRNRDQDGYGKFTLKRFVQFRAHRFALFLDGRLDPEAYACHTCDNPPCCNPAHLWSGTNQDNINDRHSKGRSASGQRSGRYTKPERNARGEQIGISKLTETQVREIRALYASGAMGGYRLAKQFGVSKPNIYAIVKRETWKHI